MGTLNRLGIKLTSEQLSTFTADRFHPFIDAPNSLFIITLPPDGYAPGYRALGEQGVNVGYTSATVLISKSQYSIGVSTVESQDAFYEILQTIYDASLPENNGGYYRTLEVWDYHRLDNATARSAGYTVRRMAMFDLQARSGSIGAYGQVFTVGGFTFNLVEV